MSRTHRDRGSSMLIFARAIGTGPKCARTTIMSPSRRRSTKSSIPQTLAALSTIASSTGCTSVGERLMMPSTSAVAV